MRKLTEAKGWAPNLIGLVVLYEEENALRLASLAQDTFEFGAIIDSNL